METIEITIRELRQICLVVYMGGLVTTVVLYYANLLFQEWRADRRRREQFKIHRRTPFGI